VPAQGVVALFPENRTLKTRNFTSRAGSRTARKYSNATESERLHQTAADH